MTSVQHPIVTVSKSPEETIAYGRKLPGILRAPAVVLLRGDLGAGKTMMVKGIAEGFAAATREDVTSPTFTLVHEYRGADVDLFHIDLYRIDTLKELDTLALEDLRSERSILLVEWGEKFERFRDQSDHEIAIERVSDEERKITLSTRGK